jgi:hypothetical protein
MKRKLTKSQKHQKKAAAVGKKRIAAVKQQEAEAAVEAAGKAIEKKATEKKLTPKEEAKAGKTEAKKLKAIMDGPRIFLDNNRHAYILVEARRSENRYLTMRDGEVEVMGIDRGSRDMTFLKEHDYDVKRAAVIFFNSFLPKSSEATAELCKILGKPVPEVSEEIKASRRARGQRLQAARAPRVGYTIQQLCEKLKIAPQVARKALRKSNVEKPQAGWVWPTEKEADAVAKHVGLTK